MRFILDTQIFLHYNSFVDCDWKSIIGEDSLTLVVPQTVLSELDEKKYDQRDHIRKRAREVISKFRYIKNGGKVPCGINVEFMRNLNDDVDLTKLGLNNSNKDHQIIGEILRIKNQFNDDDICLVTADMNMELQAENYNIKVILPPDEWLLVIKDPRDEKLARLEKTFPKIRFCFYDERDKSLKDTLEKSIEFKSTDDLIQDDIEKEISKIKQYVEKKIENKKYGYFTPVDYIEIYKNKMRDYIKLYRNYLYNVELFKEWNSSAIKIILCLENIGSIPADDVDVWIIFPKCLEVRKNLPEYPKKPLEPEPPNDIFDPSYNYHSFGEVPSSDLSNFIRNQKEISGPDIQESMDNVSVHYWRRKLKQELNWPLPLYIKLGTKDSVHIVYIEYSIKIGNMPIGKRGRLKIAFSDKNFNSHGY